MFTTDPTSGDSDLKNNFILYIKSLSYWDISVPERELPKRGVETGDSRRLKDKIKEELSGDLCLTQMNLGLKAFRLQKNLNY